DERQHRLIVDVPESLRVHADPLRLAQVLSNLMTNAAKYTNPRGTIRVTAAARGDDKLAMSAEAPGIGMPSEDLPRVFGMCAQLRSGQDHSAGGLGIGLALAKGIVELHGGRIEASSGGPGLGSRFSVFLPAAARATAVQGAPRAELNGHSIHRRILL